MIDANSPYQPSGLGLSADGRTVVGHRWSQDRWQAFQIQSGERSILDPAPGYANAEAVGTTSDGSLTVGRVYNIAVVSPKQQLLVSEYLRDVRPVVWSNGSVRFLDGFDRSQNWWPTGISDDGQVVVGVTWPQTHHFFKPHDYRSGVAFRWEAGQVELLGSLANHQHSQAFAVSGDGRVITGTCFRRTRSGQIFEEGFVWDTVHGMRSLQDVLSCASADLAGWTIQRGVALSSDGQILAGNALNSSGRQVGWVARFPDRFFGDH